MEYTRNGMAWDQVGVCVWDVYGMENWEATIDRWAKKKKKKKKKPVTVCEEDEKTFEGGLQGGKPQPTGMYVGSCKVSDEFSALMVQRFYLARCFNSLMIIHPTTPELHVA